MIAGSRATHASAAGRNDIQRQGRMQIHHEDTVEPARLCEKLVRVEGCVVLAIGRHRLPVCGD